MSYPLNYCIPIGETGITDLRAQFMVVDTGALVNSGLAIDDGFYEDGGYYYWEYSDHADNFYGLVKFYKASAPSVTLGMLALNSREAENLDAKVSTRSTPTQVNTEVDAALLDVGLTTTITGRIDAAITSRMATFAYTAPDNAGIAAILDDTGTAGVVISTSVMQALADVMLSRSFETVEDTASLNSLAEAIMAILNSRTVGEDWIIKKSDGTTFNTRVLELDEDALPVTGTSNA